jgi:hypothetical protein
MKKESILLPIIILIISLIIFSLVLVSSFKKKERYLPGFWDWITGEEEKKECPADNFILGLYSKLSNLELEGQSGCFLNGAFVLEDQGGKVFDLLTKECPSRYTYRIGARIGNSDLITHDVFMNSSKFNNRNTARSRIEIRLDEDFNKNFNFAKLGDISSRILRSIISYFNLDNTKVVPVQYEYTLSPALQFLCDKECRDLPENIQITKTSSSFKRNYPSDTPSDIKLKLIRGELDNCTEDKREKKGIILFYPFQIIFKNLSTGKEERKRYLYLKLEESGQRDFGHTLDAFKTYILKEDSKADPYLKRRERLVRDKDGKNKDGDYPTTFKPLDETFYTLNLPEGINNSLNFYNSNLRVNNEFFVNQTITNQILNQIGISTFDIPDEEGGRFFDVDLP